MDGQFDKTTCLLTWGFKNMFTLDFRATRVQQTTSNTTVTYFNIMKML